MRCGRTVNKSVVLLLACGADPNTCSNCCVAALSSSAQATLLRPAGACEPAVLSLGGAVPID
jgi:hypothetical protein